MDAVTITIFICIIVIALGLLFLSSTDNNDNDLAEKKAEEAKTKLAELRAKNEALLNEADAFPSERIIALIGFQTRLLIGVNTQNSTILLYTDNSLSEGLSNIKYLGFNNIIDCTMETVTSTTASKQNGVGRAVVGGILAGGAGAVIGAATAKTSVDTNIDHVILNIYTNDILNPLLSFTAATDFNTVQEAYALFKAIIANNQSITQGTPQPRIAQYQNAQLPNSAGHPGALAQPVNTHTLNNQSAYNSPRQLPPQK